MMKGDDNPLQRRPIEVRLSYLRGFHEKMMERLAHKPGAEAEAKRAAVRQALDDLQQLSALVREAMRIDHSICPHCGAVGAA